MSKSPRKDSGGRWIWTASRDVPSALTHVKIVDGRVVVDRLVISAPDITAATLRGISLARIVAFAGQLAQSGQPETDTKEGRALVAAIDAFPLSGRPRLPEPTSARPPLTRPTGADPEGFYRRVADAYSEVVLATKTPAKVLADEAGVPVTTVHRWIREARQRGYLPPARKGRAG